MTFKGKAWTITTLFLIIIIMLTSLFIPRQVDKVIYDPSIVFDEVTITKFYYDSKTKLPNSTDYLVTDQEDISKIRGLLSKVKVTQVILKPDNTLLSYYMITFRNTKTRDKTKVYIHNKRYLTTNIESNKKKKIFNEEIGEEIVVFIESLIDK